MREIQCNFSTHGRVKIVHQIWRKNEGRPIFQMIFNMALQDVIIPSAILTVYEKLLTFRGRCLFVQNVSHQTWKERNQTYRLFAAVKQATH